MFKIRRTYFRIMESHLGAELGNGFGLNKSWSNFRLTSLLSFLFLLNRKFIARKFFFFEFKRLI